MLEIQKTIIKYHKMLDAIRIFQNCDFNIETLKDYLNISRSTADKEIFLLQDEVFYPNYKTLKNKVHLISKSDRKIAINRDICFFLGISIGSTNIRVTLLRLDFSLVTRDEMLNDLEFNHFENLIENENVELNPNSYSFATPKKGNHIEEIRDLINEVITPIIDRHSECSTGNMNSMMPFHLLGIGFSVSGPVDYFKKEWSYAPRIDFGMHGIRGITLRDLLRNDVFNRIIKNNIFLSLDNNAKAAMVSEYQFLMEKHQKKCKENLAVLYIGTGIGMAAVIGKKLLRGEKNYAGEIADLHININENIENDPFSNRIESLIDKKSDCTTYIPYIMNAITCVTGIENVILIGHNITENLIYALMDRRFNFTLKSTSRYCGIVDGRGVSCSAAVGAAIQSYFSMCNFDLICDFINEDSINLADDITW